MKLECDVIFSFAWLVSGIADERDEGRPRTAPMIYVVHSSFIAEVHASHLLLTASSDRAAAALFNLTRKSYPFLLGGFRKIYNGAVSFATASPSLASVPTFHADRSLRDPPSLLASSELRDLPLRPTHVEDARIAIIHPQLRDLILPLERGRVLHPRNNSIEEVKWKFVEGIYTGNGRRDGTEDEDVSMDAGEGLAGDDAASKGVSTFRKPAMRNHAARLRHTYGHRPQA